MTFAVGGTLNPKSTIYTWYYAAVASPPLLNAHVSHISSIHALLNDSLHVTFSRLAAY